MNLFITGATGYIGRVVTEKAIAAGHAVRGLSRSEEGDARLRALGAVPVRGELASLELLGRESEQADAVLHLGFIHDFSRDFGEILKVDMAAVDAIGAPLRKTGKAFVITAGTAATEPDPAGGETNEAAPLSQTFILRGRHLSEEHALLLAGDGVRVSSLRLPPYVYGRGGSFFAPLLIQMAAKAGESIYVDAGTLRTSDVHVDDAAELYLLAMESAKAGDIFNGTGSTSVTLRQLAETIGAALEVPVRSVTREEAEAKWGKFLASFVQNENRASNRKAVTQLGWHPKGVDLLTDLRAGSYREMAAKLRKS